MFSGMKKPPGGVGGLLSKRKKMKNLMKKVSPV